MSLVVLFALHLAQRKAILKNGIEGVRGYIVGFFLLHTFPFIFFYMLV